MKKGAKSELAFVGSLFLIGAIAVWDTSRTELPALNMTVKPTLFPYVIGIFLMVLCLVLAISIVRGNTAVPEGLEPGDTIEKTDYVSFLYVLGSIVAYLILINHGGFVVATTVSFVGIVFAFGDKRIVRATIFAFIFSVVVFVSFTHFLHVDLPVGIFKGIL
jgi:putative tricarboxylic transport membrane protein